jgi:hypothetical protein
MTDAEYAQALIDLGLAPELPPVDPGTGS